MRSLVVLMAFMGVLCCGGAFHAHAGNCNGDGDDNCSPTTNYDNDLFDYDDNSVENHANAGAVGVGVGGQGGEGGAGGTGVAFGGFASGGDATQGQIGINSVEDSGNSAVGNGIGNFSPDATATAFGAQGQQQGQIGVNLNKTEVDTTDVNVVKGASQGQEQDNTNFNSDLNKNTDIFTAIDASETVYEAADLPVNSAAASIGGSCNSGIALSFKDVAGSIGSGSVICDMLAIARGYAAVGDLENSAKMLEAAKDEVKFQTFFSRVKTVLTLGLVH